MRLDDELFVTRCLEGDQAAFTCLVSKYREMVHAYAYHKVGSYQEAEDITQEVFIKAYSKLRQLRWPHRFQSWLYSIVANECKMWLRSRSKQRIQEVPLEDVSVDELNGIALRSGKDEEINLTVKRAMETLPDDRQLVLSLFYMSSLSIKEIAYFMGVSPNSVGIKLHRARKQLGERLEKMIGKQLNKEKLKAGFVFKVVDSIRDMPIPSLPKPRPTKWIPVPISIGIALLIGIIGYGVSSGKDVSSDIPVLKSAKFEVSLLSDPDRQTILDTEPENISNLAAADAGDTQQTQPISGTSSSGVVVRRIGENALFDSSSLVSPNGRYLSYINWETGGNLAIQEFETGESRDITDEGNSGKDWQFADVSTWSPDSKQIAYLWWRGYGDESGDRDLRIVGIDGSKPRVLYSSPAESGALIPRAWSRDGKHILAIHWKEEDETRDIVLVSVADGSIRVLKSLEKLLPMPCCRLMSLSPDGRYVVYAYPQSKDSPKRDIFLLATDGSHETTLVKHPAHDGSPFWAPDGDRIVFASDRSGSIGLWILDVVDGKSKGSPQFISGNLNGMLPLGLTQDGSYYYGLPGRANDIYFADLDPEIGKVVKPATKAVQNFEGLNSLPDFSPDGKRLVYVRPGGRPLIVRSLETGEEHELQPDRPLSYLARSAPRWFPDGRSILVGARAAYSAKETRWGLHQVHVETGAVTHVLWGDEQGSIYRPTPPVFSPDGSRIFFRRYTSPGTRIYEYDLDAEQERKLDFHLPVGAKGYASGLALSPDGRQLALIIVFDDGFSLRIAPSAGGEMREVLRLPGVKPLPFPDRRSWLVWTPDGRHLLFARPKDEATELWRISVEGGDPENLGLTMKKMESLSIHPGGLRIAFTGPGPRPGAEVWAIENFLPTSTASR